jgi:hypothetical protein
MHNLDKIMGIYEKIKGCSSAEIEVGELWDPGEFKEMLTTLMPDSKITVTEIPLQVKCECGYKGSAPFPPHSLTMRVLCPKCGKETEIVSGKELSVKSCNK